MTIDEEDDGVGNSSCHSTHRLPTLSASQALQNARSGGPRTISTGLEQLDAHLSPRILSCSGTDVGLPLGQVTEVYGPPGSAKTTFGLQLCASVVRQGGRGIWIDTATPIARARLNECIANRGHRAGSAPAQDATSSMRLLEAPTLPHLLALLRHLSSSVCGTGTRLIVVDTISAPLERAYARDDRGTNVSGASKWAAGRKFAVMGELVRSLGKMAAMHDLAVVLLCQCATKLRPGAPAILLPSTSGHEWDAGVSLRIVLYRDWPPRASGERDLDVRQTSSTHYAAVCKVGASQADSDSTIAVPFNVSKHGLSQVEAQSVPRTIPAPLSPARPEKRAYVEIADSDAEDPDSDDDFGWMDEDEVTAANIAKDCPTEIRGERHAYAISNDNF